MKKRRDYTYAAQKLRRKRFLGVASLCLLLSFAAVLIGGAYALKTNPRLFAHVAPTVEIPVTASTGTVDPIIGLPNAQLTPGLAATADAAMVCKPGYATRVRPTGSLWRSLKDRAYARYGIPRGHRSSIDAVGVHHPSYQIDHLIPLELGGDPIDTRNLWPQPIVAAEEKDRIENDLHALVCGGHISLEDAQRRIAQDWMTAIR